MIINKRLQTAYLSQSLQDLPEEITTFNKIRFNPKSDRWSYRDSTQSVSINFKSLNAAESLALSIKKGLIWYAENKSSAYMLGIFSVVKTMLLTIEREKNEILFITASDLLNYRSTLSVEKTYYLGRLSTFLRKLDSLGLLGVSDDAITLLKQLRLKGCVKGEAVLTMDPIDGPYTDIEVQSIIDAVNTSYDLGKFSLENYVLVHLMLALGARPSQFASIKVSDFGISAAKDGATLYTLNIPRVKQRGYLSRSQFTQRVLIPHIGEKLAQHIFDLKIMFAEKLSDCSHAPLFPAKQSKQDEPAGFEFHKTAGNLGRTITKSLNTLEVFSERTGEQLHITPIRFRRTLGTRAAMEGHGELVIAELLDHTDTQNVGVYVQATPEIVGRIDRAMALHLAPLAQAFSGVIIKNESEARRKDDPTSRICEPRFEPSMKPMGNCGQYGFCGQLAPISCYTCRNFQPWLDGPHEAVLNHLISERERLMVTSDSRIASINDRTILAVAYVVKRCDEIKNGMSETVNG
ncbi:MAG: integrase [Methylotenera sp.]|jgi:integrase|nr:MAG: integrase [Methylotenera sp.]